MCEDSSGLKGTLLAQGVGGWSEDDGLARAVSQDSAYRSSRRTTSVLLAQGVGGRSEDEGVARAVSQERTDSTSSRRSSRRTTSALQPSRLWVDKGSFWKSLETLTNNAKPTGFYGPWLGHDGMHQLKVSHLVGRRRADRWCWLSVEWCVDG